MTLGPALGSADRQVIEAEIAALRGLGIDALRARWRILFKSGPPPALTKDLLGRMIAWRIQEQAYGGHDRATLKLLDGYARGKTAAGEGARRLKVGTVLVREYQGERHTVTIVTDGFVWREQTYQSLSGIARAITGISWNGPRFFGLRVSKDKPQAEQSSEPTATDTRAALQRSGPSRRPVGKQPCDGPEAPR